MIKVISAAVLYGTLMGPEPVYSAGDAHSSRNYRELLNKTTITAEQLWAFPVCTPVHRLVAPDGMPIIPQLLAPKGNIFIQWLFPPCYVVGRGPLGTADDVGSDDAVGHYLIVKVKQVLRRGLVRGELVTMLFTFDTNGDLAAYRCYDGIYWLVKEKPVGGWPPQTFRLIQDLAVGVGEAQFPFDEGDMKVRRKESHKNCFCSC